jgi:hypothetical protein
MSETQRRGDYHNLPLEQHVTAYNIGHYEQLPPAVPTTAHEEVHEEKKGAKPLEKLTHLFKRSKTVEGYPPMSEPHQGPLASTRPAREASAEPIHSLVSIYSTGRSDEIPPPLQTTTTTTITRREGEFPMGQEPYIGHLHDTRRRGEIEETPLEAYATAYHPGRSDLEIHPPTATTMEEVETKSEAEKKPGALEKLTHLFKRPSHPEYPPISGREIQKSPMERQNTKSPTPVKTQKSPIKWKEKTQNPKFQNFKISK